MKTNDALTDVNDQVVKIEAKPHPFSLETAKSAVLVIDMQNDFGADGGMFHRAGIDISMIQQAMGPTRRVLGAARAFGIPIIYLKMAFQPDLSDAGPLDSPNYLRGVHGHASKNIVSFNSRAGRPKPTLNSTSKQYVTTAKLHNARTFSNPFIGNRSKPNKSLICPWNGSTLVLRNANASRTSGVANNAARANRFFDVLFPTLGIGVTNVIFRLSQAFANR